ncbi:MAG: Maf family protein [Anaerolineaceae bacterium]
MTKILLASNSARRRELIKLTGWDFTAIATNINEDRLPVEQAREYVIRLAREKAFVVPQEIPGEYILTADTIVVDNETLFGKPDDPEDARRILRGLRGHNHIVMTAIALYDRNTHKLIMDLCSSNVPMRDYSEAEIDSYIASGDAMDKAGAYAIQNALFHPVTQFSGCFASVMGLPLCHLSRSAQKLGLTTTTGLPTRCQSTLCYECRIHEAVLRGDIIG